MKEIVIYHNPRCSKSRATLQLLEDRDLNPRIIEYLKTPPGTEELRTILSLLGLEPRQIMRRKEAAYRDANLDDPGLDDDALLAAITEHPILLERPIVLANGKAAIGRPPENVLDIL